MVRGQRRRDPAGRVANFTDRRVPFGGQLSGLWHYRRHKDAAGKHCDAGKNLKSRCAWLAEVHGWRLNKITTRDDTPSSSPRSQYPSPKSTTLRFDLLIPLRRLPCSIDSTDGSTAWLSRCRQHCHSRRLLCLPRNITLPDSTPRPGAKLAMDLAYDTMCLPACASLYGFGNNTAHSHCRGF